MQILDNINNTVGDDLKKIIHRGSKVSIAACFSIYAYRKLTAIPVKNASIQPYRINHRY